MCSLYPVNTEVRAWVILYEAWRYNDLPAVPETLKCGCVCWFFHQAKRRKIKMVPHFYKLWCVRIYFCCHRRFRGRTVSSPGLLSCATWYLTFLSLRVSCQHNFGLIWKQATRSRESTWQAFVAVTSSVYIILKQKVPSTKVEEHVDKVLASSRSSCCKI